MAHQVGSDVIRWRTHLRSSPEEVHRFLATEEGRCRFWAESAVEKNGEIRFVFSSGCTLRSRIIDNSPPTRFAVEYFQGSRATFELTDDGSGGTDLTLTETGVSESDWAQNHAGWVSVLLTLKAAVDFGVDLRNKSRRRSWERGYVDV